MVTTGQPTATVTTAEEAVVRKRADTWTRLRTTLRPSARKARLLSPGVTASLVPVVAALRWGAVMIGLAWAVSRVAQSGDLRVVLTLSVAIFLTSWRTIVPVRFGEPGLWPMLKASVDVVALAAAIGVSDGLSGPFVGSLFIAVAVTGFGWGMGLGLFNGIVAVILTYLTSKLFGPAVPTSDSLPGPVAITALAGVAIIPGMALDRLSEMEIRRKAVADHRDRLRRSTSTT
jgi:hypothetical protein